MPITMYGLRRAAWCKSLGSGLAHDQVLCSYCAVLERPSMGDIVLRGLPLALANVEEHEYLTCIDFFSITLDSSTALN